MDRPQRLSHCFIAPPSIDINGFIKRGYLMIWYPQSTAKHFNSLSNSIVNNKGMRKSNFSVPTASLHTDTEIITNCLFSAPRPLFSQPARPKNDSFSSLSPERVYRTSRSAMTLRILRVIIRIVLLSLISSSRLISVIDTAVFELAIRWIDIDHFSSRTRVLWNMIPAVRETCFRYFLH